VPDLLPDLDELVMAALEKNPDKRIPGCQEFLRLLGQVGTRPPDEPGHSFGFWWVIALVVVVLLILVLISIY
jgi:hypothetical protein